MYKLNVNKIIKKKYINILIRKLELFYINLKIMILNLILMVLEMYGLLNLIVYYSLYSFIKRKRYKMYE